MAPRDAPADGPVPVRARRDGGRRDRGPLPQDDGLSAARRGRPLVLPRHRPAPSRPPAGTRSPRQLRHRLLASGSLDVRGPPARARFRYEDVLVRGRGRGAARRADVPVRRAGDPRVPARRAPARGRLPLRDRTSRRRSRREGRGPSVGSERPLSEARGARLDPHHVPRRGARTRHRRPRREEEAGRSRLLRGADFRLRAGRARRCRGEEAPALLRRPSPGRAVQGVSALRSPVGPPLPRSSPAACPRGRRADGVPAAAPGDPARRDRCGQDEGRGSCLPSESGSRRRAGRRDAPGQVPRLLEGRGSRPRSSERDSADSVRACRSSRAPARDADHGVLDRDGPGRLRPGGPDGSRGAGAARGGRDRRRAPGAPGPPSSRFTSRSRTSSPSFSKRKRIRRPGADVPRSGRRRVAACRDRG